MLSNIPDELKQLAQWVVCAHDKIPLNPRTLHAASVTNSKTWGTFDQAVAAVEAGKAEHVGFVLTKDDPYVIVDLDNKPERPASRDTLRWHSSLIDAAGTYAELSMSKNGYHIIARGDMGGVAGMRDDARHIEMYSSGRYMVMTGFLAEDEPIRECQDFIDDLLIELKHDDDEDDEEEEALEYNTTPASLTDDEVFQRASEAINGDKFLALWNDDWRDKLDYLQRDNSRADHALVQFLCYYSESDEQVFRMFMASPLAQRDKVQRRSLGYVGPSIKRARRYLKKEREEQAEKERMAEAYIENLVVSAPKPPPSLESNERTRTHARAQASEYTLPPGLVGDIARYAANASRYTFKEAGLTVGLAVVAGIAGRTYTVGDLGLSTYFLLLAGTGTGKNSTHKAITALTKAVDDQRGGMPGMTIFRGGNFRSGVALRKALAQQPCLLVQLPEVAADFKKWTDPRATEHVRNERQLLLDVWTQNGPNGMLSGLRYSDKEKDTVSVASPNLTLIGESVQEEMLELLNGELITSGFLPRFTVIEYRGKRPDPNVKANPVPPSSVVDRLTQLVETAITAQANETRHTIGMTAQAEEMLFQFELACNREINANGAGLAQQKMWTRAYEKTLRLAGIVAVGVNVLDPVIDHTCAQWAIDFVRNEVSSIVSKFDAGEVGSGDDRGEAEIKRVMLEYRHVDRATRQSYGVGAKLLDVDDIVPVAYLKKRLRQVQPFKGHKLGENEAIKRALADAVDSEVLVRVPEKTAREKYGVNRAALYARGPSW